jgi:hypothetical protein
MHHVPTMSLNTIADALRRSPASPLALLRLRPPGKCLKKYCECFDANISCSEICRCTNCHNRNNKGGPAGGALAGEARPVGLPGVVDGLDMVSAGAAQRLLGTLGLRLWLCTRPKSCVACLTQWC